MKELIVYQCPRCGKVVISFDKKGSLSCCNESMKELQANTTDAAKEKHVPQIEKNDGRVIATIGEIAHPMTEEHSILWIALVGEKETYFVHLKPQETPQAIFPQVDHGIIYAYCNLHGLWKKEF